MKKIFKSRTKILMGVAGIILLLAGGYMVIRRGENTKADDGVKKIVAEVSKIMVLPDEVPTVARVTDKTKLADQSFFKDATNGDWVLFFVTEGKAVLYRQSIKKVINVSLLKINSSEAVPTIANKKIKLFFLNGTKEAGLATKFAEVVSTMIDIPNEIVGKKLASKSDYEKTVVVDLKGNLTDKTARLAEEIGGVVGTMPEGEEVVEADILVIIGKDHL